MMFTNGHTYCIVPDVDVTQDFVDATINTSLASGHKSLDGTLCVFLWDGAVPAVFSSYNHVPDGATVGVYTHEEILTEMAKATWTDPPL